MSTRGLGLVLVSLGSWLVSGCATATGPGYVGEGGAGGSGGAGMGGMGGMNASSSTSASSSSASSSSASSSSASSSSSGGGSCGPEEHLCSGICSGNTPQSGCFASSTCTPCPAVTNGVTTCNASGLCDVNCNAGYVKNGYACTCQQQCCSDADCGGAGQTCMAGTCGGGSSSSSSSGGGSCDQALCIVLCAAQGLLGVCLGNTCTCI